MRSSTCTTRGSGTSNMVRFIDLLLQALLFDELWTSTCPAITVRLCIKIGIEVICKSRLALPINCHTAKHDQNQGLVKLKQRISTLYICLGTNSTFLKHLCSGKRIRDWNLSCLCTHHVLCSVSHPFSIVIKRLSTSGTSGVKKLLHSWSSL